MTHRLNDSEVKLEPDQQEALRMLALARKLLLPIPADQRPTAIADLIEGLATIYERRGQGEVPRWLLALRADPLAFENE